MNRLRPRLLVLAGFVVIAITLFVPSFRVVTPSVAQEAGCAALVTSDRTLAQDLPNLNAPEGSGAPELCLLYYPADDVYKGLVIGASSAASFDAAKADALSQLPGLGVDLCKVTTW